MSNKISPHFTRKELACKDGCGFKAADIELVELLEKIRVHFNRPVKLTCACRCLKHNHEIGSKDSSQHVRGLAADFYIKTIPPQMIYDYIDEWHDKGGLGIYNNFIHIDVRGRKARWDSRT